MGRTGPGEKGLRVGAPKVSSRTKLAVKGILKYDGSLFFGDTFLQERKLGFMLPSQSLIVDGYSLPPLTALLPGTINQASNAPAYNFVSSNSPHTDCQSMLLGHCHGPKLF